MVITVNGWMNHPSGFRIVDGTRRRRPPVVGALRQPVLLARARAHVPRRLHGRGLLCRGGLRLGLAAGAAGAATSASRSRSRLPPPRSRRRSRSSSATGRRATSPSDQPIKLAAFEGLGTDDERRARAPARLVRRHGTFASGSRCPDLLSLLAFHDPNATVAGARHRAGRRPPSGERRAHRVPDDGRDRHAARAARRLPGRAVRGGAGGRCPSRAGSTAPSSLAGPLSRRRADRRLGDDRGRAPAVGRVPRHADRRRPSRARTGIPVGYGDARSSSTSASPSRSGGSCAGSRQLRRPPRASRPAA